MRIWAIDAVLEECRINIVKSNVKLVVVSPIVLEECRINIVKSTL